jgi:esterase/lipase
MDAATTERLDGRVVSRAFSDRRLQAFAAPDEVTSAEGQAALRQFSLERTMSYGTHYAVVVELRARVWGGEPWQSVAAELAETCLHPPEAKLSQESTPSRINRLFRAAALLRMSQAMMLTNTEERREIFVHAGKLYTEAAALKGDRERHVIETRGGPLVSWIYKTTAPCVGTAVVIGGVEGWAMDFSAMGLELAARGIEAVLLDGPGQGESRFLYDHFLTAQWTDDYGDVFDFLNGRGAQRPLAFIGNSIGGSLAIHLAARDPRISVCCDNGGPKAPRRPVDRPTFFEKMRAHCGPVSTEEAETIWRTVRPTDQDHLITCPLLVVQGKMDPLVSNEDAQYIFDTASSADKSMMLFSDGDHCIYNHPDDKHNLICDWVADRLGAVN